MPESSEAPQSPAPQPALSAGQEQQIMEHVLPINRNGWAIAAGWLAIFNLLLISIPVVAPISILMAIVALYQLKKTPEKKGRVRAWFAIIFSGIFLTLFALVIIFNGV